MNSSPISPVPVWLGALGVFLFAAVWFVLPLIPALVEWRRGTDAQPLRVVREYDGNVRFFAQGFLTFLDKQWNTDALARVRDTEQLREGRFPDGSLWVITPGTGNLPLSKRELTQRTVDRVIACGGKLTLPDETYFSREILSLKTLVGGDSNVYRAIRGEEAVSLGHDSVVLRWLHASGPFDAGAQSSLYGRASSDQSIQLAAETFFQRLHAPVISFGAGQGPGEGFLGTDPGNRRRTTIDKLPGERDKISGRHITDDDLKIQPNSEYAGDIVTLRNFSLGDDCYIKGNVKSRREMRIGANCLIEGSLVSEGTLYIGENCRVTGPVVAERKVVIASGAVIGRPDAPTTVSAPEIDIAPGVTAHGTVWAREAGHVRVLSKK